MRILALAYLVVILTPVALLGVALHLGVDSAILDAQQMAAVWASFLVASGLGVLFSGGFPSTPSGQFHRTMSHYAVHALPLYASAVLFEQPVWTVGTAGFLLLACVTSYRRGTR